MHRSQILLEEWQYEALKAQAEAQGKSISEVVREIVADHIAARRDRGLEKLRALKGIAASDVDARDHDEVIYELEAR
jgi:hypothetical protein